MPLPPKRVLVVDDDPELRQFLRRELMADGHLCHEAASGAQAYNRLRSDEWDLVLLDWSLPDFSGVDLCRRMRQERDATPVLMLTAHDDLQERVQALDAGADDYLTKPFEIDELLARVRAHLRRAGRTLSDDDLSLHYNDLELNPASREVNRNGTPLNLTAREFDLLHLLISKPERVQERRQILCSIWGDNWVGNDNVLDVYIRALRRKIESTGCPTLIQTVRGVGFMLKTGANK